MNHTNRREPTPRHLMAAQIGAYSQGLTADELIEVTRLLLPADAFADWLDGFNLSRQQRMSM